MANTEKRVLTLVLAVILLLGLLPIAELPKAGAVDGINSSDLKAGAEIDIHYREPFYEFLQIDGEPKGMCFTWFTMNGGSDVHPVYCVDPAKRGAREVVRDFGADGSVAGTALWVVSGNEIDPVYINFMKAGYPHRQLSTLGLTYEGAAYYATKLALWCYILGIDPYSGRITVNPAAGSDANAVLNAVKQIYDEAMGMPTSGSTTPELTITAASNGNMPDDGSGYWTGTVTVTWNTWIGDDPDASGDIELAWDSTPALTGLQVLLPDGTDITNTLRIPTDDVSPREVVLTVTVPKEGNPETYTLPELKAKALMAGDDFYLSYYKSNASGAQNYLVEGEPKKERKNETQLYYGEEDPPTTTPTPPPSSTPPPEPVAGTLRKVSAGTGEPLEGAVLRVAKLDDPGAGVVGEYVTDSGGAVELELLPGAYYVEEITPPEGYLLDEDNHRELKIAEGASGFEVTFSNKKKPGLTIYKRTSEGQPLGGATFRVALNGGTQYYERTSDGSGKVELEDLTPGTYTVTEIAAPSGYILDPVPRNVTVAAGEVAELTYTNYKGPEFLKVDEATGLPLAGAEIALYKIDGGLIWQGVSGADGKFAVDALPPGDYYAVEMAAPSSYLKDPNPRYFTVKPDGSGTQQVKFDNIRKPSLRIYKVNAQARNQGIANCVFTVTFPSGAQADYRTNSAGEILIPDLEPGIYIVQEKSAPAPYIIDPMPCRIELKRGDTEVPVWFINYPEPGFKLIKIDSETRNPLAGVSFNIKGLDSANAHINLEGLVTDINGVIDVDHLPEGTYEFTETAAPYGYIIDNRPKIAELKRTQNPDQDTKLLFTNTKYPTLEILKRDAKTGLPLPGAKFSIRRIVDGAEYLERVTDAYGKIVITDFPTLIGRPDGRVTMDDFNNGIVFSVRETLAPDGYLIDPQEYHVQLYPGKTSTLVVDDFQMPDLVIYKLDMETREPVEGAKYTIEMADGFTITDAVTDANGQILVSEWYSGKTLLPGVYKITEVSVPHPYILDDEPRYITFVPNRVNTVTFENWQMKRIKVYKYDMDTAEPLANAEFSVKVKGSDIILGEGLTNSEGYYEGPYMAPGWHTITEMAPPPGYLNSDPQSRDIFVIPGQEVVIKFDNKKKPGVYIFKYDEVTADPLPDTEFSIAHRDGAVIFEGLTNESGYIYLDNLDNDWYTVTEMKPPSGWLNSDTPTREFYAEAGKTVTIKFDNVKLPTLIVTKTDATTGKGLAGALMKIQRRNSGGGLDELGSYRTDANGQIIMPNVQPGNYVITEIQAPQGYSLPSNPVTEINLAPSENAYLLSGTYTGSENAAEPLTLFAMAVGDGAEYHGQEVPNYPLNSIVIRKTNALTGELLAGAAFEVRKVTQDVSGGSGTIIGRWTTSYTGTIIISGLEAGGYIVEEVQAPQGFTLNENSQQQAWIKADGTSIVELTFGNYELPSLVVRKYDTQTREPLQGAEFLITDSSGAVVGTSGGIFTTDANGIIQIPHLHTGGYVVRERKAPDGYLLADASQTIALIDWGKTYTVDFYNSKLSGAQIIKIDADTKLPLKDAKFNVYKKNGELIGTYTTNGDGIIIIDKLQPGWYKAVETLAPSGYILDDTPQDFEITSGEFLRLTFENKKLSALTIKKLSSADDTPLAGAEFVVTTLDGTPVGTYTTGADGTVSIPNTMPGWYVVTEAKAPLEYTLDSATQTVEVKAQTPTIVTFKDTPWPYLYIKKVDADSGTLLSGAKFTVAKITGEVIATVTSQSSGPVAVKVAPGTYVITEIQAPEGYELNDPVKTVEVGKTGATYTSSVSLYSTGSGTGGSDVTFGNKKLNTIEILKLDGDTLAPLENASFEVRKPNGELIGNYRTDASGKILIPDLSEGTYVISETDAPNGYVLDNTPKSVNVSGGKLVPVEFKNTAMPGISILKIDAETRKPIAGAAFLVTKSDGAYVGEYTTNNQGLIALPELEPGHYIATETKAAKGYIDNPEPRPFEIKAGELLTLTFENHKESAILIKKIDSITGKGIYGVTFLISDSGDNPVATATSDQNGYVYLPGIPDGKYYIREIEPAPGYMPDTTVKTFYVEYGTTENITWKNTPEMGQIQITKKSADANSVNGFPAGTYLEGAIFEIYTRAGNLVDTIKTDKNGKGYSKPLPISRYVIREVQAPANYARMVEPIDTEIELANQIVRLEVLNKSLNIGVTVKKTGPKQAVSNQEIKYEFPKISNDSNESLESFYWRDVLPTDAVRLLRINTGTWSANLHYKIVYKTNLSNNEYLTLMDNLDTSVTRVVDASPAALGLASGEYITEIMFAFGTVPAGFTVKTSPSIYCKTLPNLPHELEFANKTDLGGVYQENWIQTQDRWVTKIWNPNYKPPQMPRTGY